jgi:hypothetical protein
MANEAVPGVTIPIVVDLGKTKKKRIKELKEGRGALVTEIQQVVAEARERLGPDAKDKELIPVAVVYRRQAPRRKKGMFPFAP